LDVFFVNGWVDDGCDFVRAAVLVGLRLESSLVVAFGELFDTALLFLVALLFGVAGFFAAEEGALEALVEGFVGEEGAGGVELAGCLGAASSADVLLGGCRGG